MNTRLRAGAGSVPWPATPWEDLDPRTCGIDEAGRGPLAGPVCAAAVILDPARPIAGLAASKTLTAQRRSELAELIRSRALAWSVASASVQEIDALNILQATFLAMQRAVEGLAVRPRRLLIDGNRAPHFSIPLTCIIGGDACVASISAASILAKTARDAILDELHAIYPEWGFNQHKGYPTAAHRRLLARLGPTPEHRRSYAPVKAALAALGVSGDPL